MALCLLGVTGIAVSLLTESMHRLRHAVDREERGDREKLLKWEHAFANAAWGMAIATPDNRFIEVNRAFVEMHGSRPEEWVSKWRMVTCAFIGPLNSGR